MLVSLGVAAIGLAFAGAALVLIGGPARAGAYYPKFLMGVRAERKFALGLAVTSASCLVSGASFCCIGLLKKLFPGEPIHGYVHALILSGVGALAAGPLACELIWLWMLGPVDGRMPLSAFFRWNEYNRFGAMLLLRWTGAFALFMLTYRAASALEVAGASLIVYSLMLGFLDAAVLSGLRPSPLRPEEL